MREGSEATGVAGEGGGLQDYKPSRAKVEDWWTQDSVVGEAWGEKGENCCRN